MICIIIGLFLVLIWFINTSTIGGQGTWHVGDWTLNYVIGFMILLCLWELLFVGVPTALFFGVGGYLWWRRLPEEKKQEYRGREKKEKAHKKEKYGGGGGGSGGGGDLLVVSGGFSGAGRVTRSSTPFKQPAASRTAASNTGRA